MPLRTLSYILRHPLNRSHKIAAVRGYLSWQLGSRLVPGPVAVPFIENYRLLVRPGMTGATGNIYCGLHEYEDMSFVLHTLRSDDIFVDVGANVGSYTILAAGPCHAHVISIEALPSTFEELQTNIRLNGLDQYVEALNVAVAARAGAVWFSTNLGTMNHVLTCAATMAERLEACTLDDILADRSPTLLKIDVEGFEHEVIEGAGRTLSKPDLLGIVVELNGSGERYGKSDGVTHQAIMDFGFRPYIYDPEKRSLRERDQLSGLGNTIYLRNEDVVRERLQSAPTRKAGGRRV